MARCARQLLLLDECKALWGEPERVTFHQGRIDSFGEEGMQLSIGTVETAKYKKYIHRCYGSDTKTADRAFLKDHKWKFRF